MKTIIFFTMLLTITITCYSQNVDSAKQNILNDTTSNLKKKIYVININRGGLNPSFGYLQSLNDTTLSLASSPLLYGTTSGDKLLSYNSINNIRIHKKGQARRGALIGAVAGIVLGGIIGAVTYVKPQLNGSSDGRYGAFNFTFDFGVGFDIAVGSAVGFLLGLPIGYLSGSGVNKYDIDKNKQAFENMRSQLIDVYGMEKSFNHHDK